MAEFVSVEVEHGVATILLHRPPMNALCLQMQGEIRDGGRGGGPADDVGAVVVYGGPKVFAAGADIKEMGGDVLPGHGRAPRSASRTAFTAVARIPKPIIAAVTGYALGGGCELALCCDLRIAADDAKLGQPEILLGIIPGAGGTQRLPRLVGVARAKDLIFTGRLVDADEALAIGLVDRVVPAAEVLRRRAGAGPAARQGPALALRAAKEAIDRGLEMDLETGLDIERVQFAALFATEDQSIGMSAFMEKRPAEFTGN